MVALLGNVACHSVESSRLVAGSRWIFDEVTESCSGKRSYRALME